jgi:hypothetical protein
MPLAVHVVKVADAGARDAGGAIVIRAIET